MLPKVMIANTSLRTILALVLAGSVAADDSSAPGERAVLAFIEAHHVTLNPLFSNGDPKLALSRDGQYVYAGRRTVRFGSDNKATLIFRRDAENGKLTLLEDIRGPRIDNIAIGPDDRQLFCYQ
jgi:hypothetical protein